MSPDRAYVDIFIPVMPEEKDDGTKTRGNDPLLGTGWAALRKTVREFDEEAVKFCRDDIDTLLVFVSRICLLTRRIV